MEIPHADEYASAEGRTSAPSYSIRDLLYPYCICVFLFFLSLMATAVGFGPLFVFVYIGSGIFLSRRVSEVITWNSHIASLGDVARAKALIWLNWPISILRLIVDIAIAKHL